MSLKTCSKENIIYGKHSVLEALQANKRTITKIIILNNIAQGKIVESIIKIAKKRGINIYRNNKKLIGTQLYKKSQGIIAQISNIQYLNLTDLITRVKKYAKYPILVISDGITDPHNLGAIIRNCVAFGVHGIIIPKRNNASINETVVKVSVGATEHILISKIININHSIKVLKANGFFVIGTVIGKYEEINNIKLYFPLVIILGNENHGIHFSTKKQCDKLISISQYNSQITSLNVSCASAIILYEISKQKKPVI
ncbi:MAG: 23S rRNA (guanosine(2251)-2'-O)-methyltransferase RlmB [Endomicrobium sp.]|jgi:23S rRNA (guanosine2251-2'-O)-methyltransferase|nr:23S rRNA (guanosine(2251)-2'-O)-methyltransferase RlmB [Endomicrobium sp.]